jgi:hypothetical protein
MNRRNFFSRLAAAIGLAPILPKLLEAKSVIITPKRREIKPDLTGLNIGDTFNIRGVYRTSPFGPGFSDGCDFLHEFVVTDPGRNLFFPPIIESGPYRNVNIDWSADFAVLPGIIGINIRYIRSYDESDNTFNTRMDVLYGINPTYSGGYRWNEDETVSVIRG